MANISSEATITIDRPAGEVWQWVVNPANLNLWMKDVDDSGSWIEAGGPTVGSRYRIDYKYGRKTNEIIFEVVNAVPGQAYVVDTVEGPYPILVDYLFEEADEGKSTELNMLMNARSDSKFTAVMFILTGWFAKWFMKRRIKGELREMKYEIEAS